MFPTNSDPHDHGLNRTIRVSTPFGDVNAPLMLIAAAQGGAPVAALLQLWERMWPTTFPGVLTGAIVLARVEMARIEAEITASRN